MIEKRAPYSFENEQQAIAYIADCERQFRDRVIAIAQELAAEPDLHLIGLSGPTCAGKTTTGTLLIDHLQRAGHRVHMISVDDFFREQPGIREQLNRPDAQPPDFDSIDALDLELFTNCLDELMQTGHTVMPRFNLGEGIREGTRELKVEGDNDVFLLEGIQVVYPEINALLRRYHYRSIFANVGSALTVGGVTYAPEQIRLLRRVVRDYHFRSSDADFTFFLWNSVRDNEEKNILPYADSCDVRLDSLMPYEIGMLRPYLELILGKVAPTSKYRAKADEILSNVSHVQPLSNEWLPSDALYREFVPVKK